MSDFRADLHVHSYFSDGTDSPETLIDLAIENGLSALSITDHDTLDAYDEALVIAQQKDFFLLPGVEFSAFHQGMAIHILGYSFNLKSDQLQAFCVRHRQRRIDRNRKILDKLKGIGIVIDEEALNASGRTIGRPHIALEMVNQGIVPNMRKAFDLYLEEGKRAYDAGEPISVLETIKTIQEAGGFAVLAHPHLIKRQPIVRQLLKMPFDGIETFYARFPFDQEKKWVDIAEKQQWIMTGGSDYHGANKPFNVIGSSWVNEPTFKALYDHYLIANS